MSDYSYDQVIEALRIASSNGDQESAVRLARMAQQMRADQPSVAADVPLSVGSGILRGVAGVMDAPGAIFTLGNQYAISGIERAAEALGVDQPQIFEAARQAVAHGPLGSGQTGREAVDILSGGYSEREPQTTPGQYARTVGEFIPGAVAGGVRSLGGLLRYAVAPALTSEAAGQATRGVELPYGIPAEPVARLSAALATPSVIGRTVSPMGGADPERLALTQRLRREGVDVSAGEETGSAALRRMEGAEQASQEQLEQFTAAAMRSIGSDATRATPQTLAAANDRISDAYDAVLQGVSIVPSQSLAQRAVGVADRYMEYAPSATVVPRIRNVVDEILDQATSPTPRPFTLERLRAWRTELGRIQATSREEATREAAAELRRVIDDATDEALIAANRADDVQRLRDVRREYQNFLSVLDAASRSGAETGILSPTQLNAAVTRIQGRRRVTLGRGTDLSELSRAGAGVLRPMPTVEAGAARNIPQLNRAGAAAAGSTLGYQLAGSPGAIAGAAIGGIAPTVSQQLVGSAPIQAYLRNQLMRPSQGVLSRVAPGAYTSAANQPQ